MFRTKEKYERALGVRLNLKPERCSSPKCALVKRPYRPGMHGQRRQGQPSEMKTQLQEKQRLRLTYGLHESAMRRAITEAMHARGNTADLLMGLLERRLDTVVYRLGLSASRSVGRQLVNHGHICVNGRKVTIPSFRVKKGDIITIRKESREHPLFKAIAESFGKTDVPVWLTKDAAAMSGTVLSLPKDIPLPFDISLIIDYYSK